MKLTTTQMDELKNLVDSKMDEIFDTVTYLLEDFVEGEHYDKDGNVTKEFAELREIAVRLIQLKAEKWQNGGDLICYGMNKNCR